VPLEPLYSLDVAVELIPCSKIVLEHILSRRASEFDPPLWHTMYHEATGKGNPACRMLRESECLKIRGIILKSGGPRRTGLKRDRHLLTGIGRFLEVDFAG